MIREEDFYYQYDKEDCMMLIPREIFYELYDDAKELEQYKTNWEELKKWLSYEWYEMGNDINCEEIIRKMKELEEDK